MEILTAIAEKRQVGKNSGVPCYVEISSIIHATEDLNKVEKAIRNIFPEEFANEPYEKSDLMGYHRNPIVTLRTFIREKAKEIAFLKNILCKLEADDKACLSSEFKNYIDSKGNFYLRLDKQEAFLGKIKLGFDDTIHIKVKLGLTPITLEELEFILNTEK